jgi:CBS domain containing-hemolysin-like protein
MAIVLLYVVGGLILTAGLVVTSYLDRIYRELGRVTTSRVHEHLTLFETDIEPRLKIDRARASAAFSLLARIALLLVGAAVARSVLIVTNGPGEATLEIVLLLGAEVVVCMQLLPLMLLAGTQGRWLLPLVPGLRVLAWISWPVLALLDLATSLLRLSEEESGAPAAEEQAQQAIEALVDAATEEGIIEQDQARLIEQVVEFGDKRVRDVMTPRPDVVAIPARSTLEELRERMVETKFSRLPVYEKSLDDVVGIVMARDMLEVSDREAARRTVRELMRPALFVPETKFGSALLQEMQRKSQQMAIVIDEYGLVAGVVTIEDLVEEIVGEIGEEDRRPAPDAVRDGTGAVVLRGSVPLDKLAEIFGEEIDLAEPSNATTVAGLLNSIAGHVPGTGEVIDHDGLRFEVLEANQRKVLRVRARRVAPSATAASATV